MAPRPYQPSGRSGPGGLPFLALACLAAGVAVGLAEGLLVRGRPYQPYLTIPVGLAVGLVARWSIRWRRIRAPLAAALLAGAGAFGGQFAYHLGAYVRFRGTVFEEISVAPGGRPERHRVTGDDALRGMTGSHGFTGYMLFRLGAGGATTQVSWAIQVLVAVSIAALMAAGGAARPFCERCGAWYGREEEIASGSPDKERLAAVVAALDQREWGQAVAALGDPGERALAVLRRQGCPRCEQADSVLSVYRLTRLTRGQANTALAYRTILRPEEESALRRALAARPAGLLA